MPADLHTVRSWLKHLGALTQASIDGREAEVRLQVLTPALAAELPTAAFCPESARAVAADCPHGFPTFGEALKLLRLWWRKQRDPFDLPMLERAGPAERQEVEDAERAASWSSMSAMDVKAKIRALDGHPMRLVLGKILGAAVRRYTPQHMALIPVEWLQPLPADNDNAANRGPAA